MKQAENPRKKNVESHPKQAALKTTNRPTARDHHGQRRNWPPPGLLRISNQLTHTPIHTPPATFPPLLLAFCVLFLFASPQGRQREREREKKIPTLTDKGTGRKERTRDRERERAKGCQVSICAGSLARKDPRRRCRRRRPSFDSWTSSGDICRSTVGDNDHICPARANGNSPPPLSKNGYTRFIRRNWR